MSITITTDVFCNICSNWEHGVSTDKAKIRLAREIAHEGGWITKRRDGKLKDFCPECQVNDPDEVAGRFDRGVE